MILDTNDSMQSRDCIGSYRDSVWSNDRLVWVVKCLIVVERSQLGMKGSISVLGRSLRAQYNLPKKAVLHGFFCLLFYNKNIKVAKCFINEVLYAIIIY